MPKIVDHDERRREISAAITQIIVAEGFERVTMRELAARIGFAHGVIIKYFPNKQSILAAAVTQLYSGVNERLARQVEGYRGLEALERMFRALLPFGSEAVLRARAVIAFWNYAVHNPELSSIHRENNLMWRREFHRFLVEAREDGELGSHLDIDAAVNRIVVSSAGWQMTAVLLPEFTRAAHLEQELTTLMESLRASEKQVRASGKGAAQVAPSGASID